MPINFTDFSRLPVQDNGYGNLLHRVVEGMKAQRMPGAMNRQQQEEELKNAFRQMQNQYYPQIQDQKLREGALDEKLKELNLNYLPQQMEAQQKETALRQSLMELQNQFLPQTHAANLDLLKARTNKANRIDAVKPGRHSPTYNDLLSLYPEGSDEFKRALLQSKGLPTGATQGSNIDDRVPFSELSSKNEQLDVSKRMRNDLKAAHSVKKAIGTLRDLRKLTEANPGLSDTFANIWIDPKNESSWLSKAGKTLLNKKDRAAIETYRKLSNDLILQGGEGLGAKNFTDAKAKLLELAKPSTSNSQQANLYVIDHMMRQLGPWEAYANDLKKGLRDRKVVEFDLDKYEQPQEDEWEIVE